jgi:GNAT superfamily N-acetyltransferase
VNLEIFPLDHSHRDAWQPLAEGYKTFYNTPTSPAEYEAAWSKLMSGHEVHGIGASLDGRLVGIAHFLFHSSTWAPRICYLQDLFTEPQVRGQGIAKALIQEIARQARAAGAARYYWLTQENNAVARVLYEKLARYNGFIRYDFALPDGA